MNSIREHGAPGADLVFFGMDPPCHMGLRALAPTPPLPGLLKSCGWKGLGGKVLFKCQTEVSPTLFRPCSLAQRTPTGHALQSSEKRREYKCLSLLHTNYMGVGFWHCHLGFRFLRWCYCAAKVGTHDLGRPSQASQILCF